MRKSLFALLLLLVVAALAMPAQNKTPVELPELGPIYFTGPYGHENLTIFLLHGRDASKREITFITLNDALEQKKVIVRETSEVNRLEIENLSAEHVFIQAGDIVKGGKQDRLIAYDLLLKPGSGKVPIGAFCVEQGRWRGRGDEAVGHFASSKNRASGSALKAAFREEKSQSAVWARVAKVQKGLAEEIEVVVADPDSPTSLELSLDNAAVKKAKAAYIEALGDEIDGKDDVVGMVTFINGEIQGANLYAWHDLFVEVWPELLSEVASDALAAGKKRHDVPKLTPEELRALLAPPKDAAKAKHDVLPGLVEEQASYGDNVRFVSKDKDLGWTRAEAVKRKK